MTNRADFIIPECYIDTNLVETLVCHGGCNHQKGCNQVVKIMKEKFADRFAVGIIDADKRRPSYVEEFFEIATSDHIQLLRHKQRIHFLIMISPAADGFILSCAEASAVRMEEYDLSSALKGFTIQTKNVLSNKDARFKRLFNELKDHREMKLFQNLLIYLTSRTYKSDDKELRSIFNS